jgi:hypothetical protein
MIVICAYSKIRNFRLLEVSKVRRDILPVRLLLFCSYVFIIILTTVISAAAQDTVNDFAPPPVRTVTKDEAAHLNEETDVKKRTKLALGLMGAHLSEAERLNSNQDYDGLFRALGGFHGLLDNTLDFLVKHDPNNGKVLDNLKRLEIGLREFTPRLEGIRRDLPIRYEDYVESLMKYVRDARERAIEPMFGNSVVPTKKPD